MRMFGVDTYYQSFNGMSQLLKKFAFLLPAKIFGYNLDDEGLNDIDFSRSSIFLDGSIVVPTVSGTTEFSGYILVYDFRIYVR